MLAKNSLPGHSTLLQSIALLTVIALVVFMIPNQVLPQTLVVGTGWGGGIVRYDLDGGTTNTVQGAASNKSLGNIDVDPLNNRVYWFAEWNNYLNYFKYDNDPGTYDAGGSDITTVFQFQDTSHAFSTGHLDVDPIANQVAIQESDTRSASTTFSRNTWINVRNLDSGATRTIHEVPRYTIIGWQGYYNPRPIWGKIHEVEDVAIDPLGKKVYWADSAAGTINRRNIDGSGSVQVLYSGLATPTHLALDVGARRIYFTELGDANGAAICHASMDPGGSVTDIITGLTGNAVTDLDIDPLGGKIYWCDYNGATWTGYVHRADFDGTAIEDVLNGSGGVIDGRLVALEPSAGAVPQKPFEGSSVSASLLFDEIGLPQAGRTLFFAADYAAGFDFEVTSTQFASVLLPDTGDGLYELYQWDGEQYAFAQSLSGGEPWAFSPGVERFRILGVEQGEELNEEDPTTFVLGLTFTDQTIADVTITAIPEPSTLVLLVMGGFGLVGMRRLGLTLRHRNARSSTHREHLPSPPARC